MTRRHVQISLDVDVGDFFTRERLALLVRHLSAHLELTTNTPGSYSLHGDDAMVYVRGTKIEDTTP